MSSYIPIASQTLGSSASSVTFSSIPTTLNGKTLRDLVVVTVVNTSQDASCRFNFNSNTTGYNSVEMLGPGGDPISAAFSGQSYVQSFYVDTSSTTRGTWILQVFDFTQTNKHKSTLLRADNSVDATGAVAGRWANTAAITSLTVSSPVNFNVGSTFSLYGIEG